MRTVRVLYRQEADGWWAESPDVPGYTAADDTLEGLRDLVPDGISEFLEEPVLAVEIGSDFEKGMVTSRADTGSFSLVSSTGSVSRHNYSEERKSSTEGLVPRRRFASA